jgi:hypothetical protein
VTSTQSENTANVGHILTVTELCKFEVTHGVHITDSIIDQVLTYISVYLRTVIKQINKELKAHIQRCIEAEIYVHLIASLTSIGAVWLKSVLFIRAINAATNESQDQRFCKNQFGKICLHQTGAYRLSIRVFLRPLFKVSKKATACVSKWNRTMQYYLHETYKADLPIRYKINANICFNFNCCSTVNFDKYKFICPTNALFIKTWNTTSCI